MPITPFTIQVPEATLADLRTRLARTRFPDTLEGVSWEDGMDTAYLRELVAYWLDGYDWRAVERKLNAFPQYRAQVEELGIHFIHQPGNGPSPLPLVITHGWPGSIVEFLRIIPLLTDPAAHGGDARDAFHVVAPSLPGYGFSDHPRRPGINHVRVAALWVELMGQLGYDRFGAQGGDWGAGVSAALGAYHPEHLIGVHLNYVPAPLPAEPENEEDRQLLAERARWQQQETGYSQVHATKPQTVGVALNDSPAGLAAWIVEKFRTWSDCGGDVERRFSKDDLLTNVMLYWVTESATSSARMYRERMRAGLASLVPGRRVGVPTGCAIFPAEIARPPRRWAEASYYITRWTEMKAGGHFAAMEEPQALAEDIRAFFRPLRA